MIALLLRTIPLIALLALSGCASLPAPAPQPVDPMAQALQASDCRAAEALLGETGSSGQGREIEVAQVCLQVGDFRRARAAAGSLLDSRPSDPAADYAAYLYSMAGFGEWSRGTRADPDKRIQEGRAMFTEITAYLRERPLSPYTDELAPRLVRLREGIAGAEYVLAERELRYGDPVIGRARAQYVVEEFPRTQAAADAARLLLSLD